MLGGLPNYGFPDLMTTPPRGNRTRPRRCSPEHLGAEAKSRARGPPQLVRGFSPAICAPGVILQVGKWLLAASLAGRLAERSPAGKACPWVIRTERYNQQKARSPEPPQFLQVNSPSRIL